MVEKEQKEEKVLEIELLQVAEILFGRVKEQSESLRTQSLNHKLADGKINITSYVEPQLSGNMMYIRGSDKSRDYQTFFYRYKSEKEASKTAELIKQAVEEINNDPPFQRPKTPPEPLKCKKIM